MRLKITWTDDGYGVSVPNWDGGEVVTADEADRWREALVQLADVWKAGESDPLEWAVWAHDLARESIATNQTEETG